MVKYAKLFMALFGVRWCLVQNCVTACVKDYKDKFPSAGCHLRHPFRLHTAVESVRLSKRAAFRPRSTPRDEIGLILILTRPADSEVVCPPIIFDTPETDSSRRQSDRFGAFPLPGCLENARRGSRNLSGTSNAWRMMGEHRANNSLLRRVSQASPSMLRPPSLW